MFPIDRSLLPSLSTRKALLVVDPQNDFLSEDGALPVNFPMDLPERMAGLATSFRQAGGDIIWVSSRYEKSRSALDEQILTSDRSNSPRSPDHSRGRRRQVPQPPPKPCECPEAFLTTETPTLPKCVRQGTFGVEIHSTVKEAIGPRDYSLVKSYYSAFKSEQLLRLLRMRLVTELFICGASTNTSVMATAIDAASHGYTITIVDDCCGYHHMLRYRNSIKQISNTTGCDVLTAADVLASFKPKTKQSRRSGDRPATSPAGRFSTVRRSGGEDDSASSTSEILSSFESLSLSAERTADTPKSEPATENAENATLPIQPLVKPKDAETSRMSRVDSSASRSDEVDSAGRHEKSQDDESQSNDHDDKGSDVQTPTRGIRTSPPPPTQSNTIVSQSAPEISLPDKEQKATVSNPDGIKIGESTLSSDASESSSSSENTLESAGTVSETPSEKYPERTKTPSEDSKVEVNNSSAMTSQEITNPKESEPLCEGDTKVIYDVLPPPLSDDIFERLRNEVRWQRMVHQGGEVPRLVAVQGQVDQDGAMPIYRHPADESPPLLPFSPTVNEIKEEIEKHLDHPLNHVLIQFYRDGSDYISEHSDKTLDIAKGSFIANVSLGAARTMTFRTKRQPRNKTLADEESSPTGLKRQVQRAALPHNSLCKMGLTTNMRWLHGIRQDKRMDREKTEEELSHNGGRISLTFRQIGTFLDRDGRLIWGQGATAKTREAANKVSNGQTPEAIEMLRGFGRENQQTEFNWVEYYGKGFDVLHISTSPRLFLSSDPVVNMRIQLMLAEYGINYARGSMSPPGALFNWQDGRPSNELPEDIPIKFVDNDLSKTSVQGDVAIMLYLDHVYGPKANGGMSPRALAKEFTRFQQGLTLLEKYRASPDAKTFQAELRPWEAYAAEGDDFIAGTTLTLADYAFWPILNDIIRLPGQYVLGDGLGGLENLRKYHDRIRTRESGRKVLLACASCIRKKPEDVGDAATSASPSSSPSASISASASASVPAPTPA
ncbi:hypothetical protein F4804DRAFT_193547 [Jackrogersella minutella]|nr:hypothetical protein F4804DRAFT_193547 [Jackrogersella minutella]